MEEAAGSTGRRAAVREVVEEAAVRESAVVGAAARDVVEEAAVREVVVVSASKCMEPDRCNGTLR